MRACVWLVVILASSTAWVSGQGKKAASKEEPRILQTWPFGVAPDKATKVTLRGLKLEQAKEVRLLGKGTVKLLKKGTVAVPNQQDANKVGNSEVEIELTVAGKEERVELVVVTATGETKPRDVLVDRVAVVAEKEPNDGFKQSQALKVGDTVQGRIDRPQDVDVYRLEVAAGAKLAVEIHATRLGSALDAFVTLYDGTMNVVEQKEGDAPRTVTLAKAGTYYIGIQDAHDQGGPAYGYRLMVSEARGK